MIGEGVAGVRVDGDPLALARDAVAHERRRVARRGQQPGAVHREGHGARAVVGVIGEAELVAAAEAVGHPDDLVGRPDGLLDRVGRLVGRVGDAVDHLGDDARDGRLEDDAVGGSAGRGRRRGGRTGAGRAQEPALLRERPPRPRWPATARHSSTGTSPARGNLFRRPAGLADGLALKEPAPPTALYRETRPNLWVPRSRTPHPGFGVDARQPTRPARNYAMSSYPRGWPAGDPRSRHPPFVPLGA